MRSDARKCCILEAFKRISYITYKRSEMRFKSENDYMGTTTTTTQSDKFLEKTR